MVCVLTDCRIQDTDLSTIFGRVIGEAYNLKDVLKSR